MTIRHVVSWKLAAEDDELRRAEAAEIASRLNALVGVVPSVLRLSAGVNMAYEGVNWDVTLVADFEDLAALEAYQVHPAHAEVGGYIKPRVAARAAVDFEL